MQFLPQQNKVVAGDKVPSQILATGKHVVVIGGGDTGSDCVGTSNRQGAASVTQFELLPQPPEHENKALVWPYWPIKLRTSSSHEEGCERDWAVATKEFVDEKQGKEIKIVRVEWKEGDDRVGPKPGSRPPGIANGFLGRSRATNRPVRRREGWTQQCESRNGRTKAYYTSVPRVFAAEEVRPVLMVGPFASRQCRSVDEFLMGHTDLPR
jgi:glutamate synthase (NADPH/NADH) small chain